MHVCPLSSFNIDGVVRENIVVIFRMWETLENIELLLTVQTTNSNRYQTEHDYGA